MEVIFLYVKSCIYKQNVLILILMNLTKKILFVILLIFIFFLSLSFLLSRLILTDRIQEQKTLLAQKITAGALSVFENESARILTFSVDWSAWDSMYNYVLKPNPEFEKDIELGIALKDSDFSFLMATNLKKEIILLEGYNNFEQRPLHFGQLGKKKGNLWKFLEDTFKEEESSSGIVRSEHGPVLVVSSPIIHSDNSGPQNGRLLMGRIVDRSFEEKITRTIHENARLLFPPANQKAPLASDTGIKHMDGRLPLQVEEGKKTITITYPVGDVRDRMAFVIRVEAQKHMFNILGRAIRLFFLLLIAGFLLSGAMFYFIVHRLVVRRMKHISRTTSNILSLDDLSLRISDKYHDEITQLSCNINKMLERLETENIRKEEVERMLVLNEKLIFLGKASATVAHEINNPLFAIANSIRVIKKHLPTDNKRLNKVVGIVEKEINRVSDIARDMHKLTMKKMEKAVLTDIITIMDAAVNVVEWSKQLKNTVIDYTKPGRPLPLECNPDALQQVFMNIILNAVDAMEGKGKVVIRVSAGEDGENVGKEYRIDFIDNGPGFDNSIKAAMFQPFRTTKPGKGSGLGLNISYNIITNYGGTITLDDSYREGAHLIVKIPVRGGSTNGNN